MQAVHLLKRICTSPKKEMYRVKQGDVHLLNYSYVRKYLILLEVKAILTFKGNYIYVSCGANERILYRYNK